MATISKHNEPRRKRRLGIRNGYFFRCSQLRYAAAYILISFVALLFLNIYAPIAIRNLFFSSQRNAINDKARLIVSAFSNYDELDEQSVRDTIRSVNDLHTTRVLVTDPAGWCLYDSLDDSQGDYTAADAVGKLTLYPEIASALTGNDVIYIRYENDVFISKAAMPIMAYNRLIGSVYLLENDRDLALLISRLKRTIFWISVGLETAIILFSLLFAALFTRRMRKVFLSVRHLYSGDYSVRLPDKGSDEIARLGSAFNELAKRLNQSEEVRKQFVSNASHELKTPLSSIKLLTDSILNNQMDEATTREFVSDIGSEADRLTRLSSKLLELTRLDSTPPDERALVSVEAVADRVLRMLIHTAREQSVTLDLDCSAGCTILCAEDDFYQILFNLVENGVKYNRPGGYVRIFADHDEESVVISVEDTGFGIPDEAKPHIFERFYRVDKARSRKAGGAGLGLSIVHDMVLRNDGTVRVEDRSEGGTRFVLSFPYLPAPEEESE